MLLAVLHRHAGVVCFDQDVFVNAVGGVKIAEPAADLAVLLAIVSSSPTALPRELVVFGEVGLAGEIRPAPAARSASRNPPSSVSAWRWCPRPTRRSTTFRCGWSRSSVSRRRWSVCASWHP
jgi:hypothetical protein